MISSFKRADMAELPASPISNVLCKPPNTWYVCGEDRRHACRTTTLVVFAQFSGPSKTLKTTSVAVNHQDQPQQLSTCDTMIAT